jgi:hypothetical protein
LSIATIWVSLNFDFRMTAPDPEQSTFKCQSIGEAYAVAGYDIFDDDDTITFLLVSKADVQQ